MHTNTLENLTNAIMQTKAQRNGSKAAPLYDKRVTDFDPTARRNTKILDRFLHRTTAWIDSKPTLELLYHSSTHYIDTQITIREHFFAQMPKPSQHIARQKKSVNSHNCTSFDQFVWDYAATRSLDPSDSSLRII